MNKIINLMVILFYSGIILIVGGCRMVDPPSDPAVIWTPPDWAAQTQEEPIWASIREKSVDLSQPLLMSDCVDLALKNSPVTRQSWAAALAAAAEVGQAESYLYPQVSVSADGTYAKQDYSLKGGVVEIINSPNSDAFNYGPGLELSWLLFDFGGVRGGVEEARQMLLATNYSFNQSIQDLILDVEKSYYELYSARSQVVAAQADVEDTGKSLEAARQKFEVGLVSKLDELQAQSTYQDSLYQLESAKGDVKSARASLAGALGIPADADFDIAEPNRELPTEVSKDDVSQLIEEGLKKRPDIASLRAELRAKEAAIDVAGSAYFPSLNLGGSANKLWYSYLEDPEIYNDSYMYTGYLSLNWDIFTGFSDREKKAAAEANAAQARESLAAAEVSASADVWTKYYAFNTAVEKYKFATAYFKTSQESYNLALESYDAGLKSILDLLQSQSSLSSARSQLISAKKDLFTTLADLAHATGTLGVKSVNANNEPQNIE